MDSVTDHTFTHCSTYFLFLKTVLNINSIRANNKNRVVATTVKYSSAGDTLWYSNNG